MKKKSSKNANAFKVPSWYRRLWEGGLFGKRKDAVILRILKLGGKDLLISQCRLPLDKDTIDTAHTPSMKLLLQVLRKAASEWREVEKASAMAEARVAEILTHPESYNKDEQTLINRKDLRCETVMWTPKRPGAKHQG